MELASASLEFLPRVKNKFGKPFKLLYSFQCRTNEAEIIIFLHIKNKVKLSQLAAYAFETLDIKLLSVYLPY